MEVPTGPMLVFGGVTWQELNEGLPGPQESSQSDGPGEGLERILWIVPPVAHLSRSVCLGQLLHLGSLPGPPRILGQNPSMWHHNHS